MEKFKSVHFKSLPIGAHYEYCSQVNSEIDNSPEVLRNALGNLTTEYKFLLAEERKLLFWVRKSVLTEEIQKANKRMDVATTAVKSLIRTFNNYPDPAVEQSAKRLHVMLKGYGYVTKKPYDEKLGDVRSMLGQIKQGGPYRNDVNSIATVCAGINVMIDELQNSFDAMEELLARREEKCLQKPDMIFRELRKRIEPIYHKIASIVNSNAVINTSDAFNNFIDRINPKVDRFNEEFRRVKHDISSCLIDPVKQKNYTGYPVTFSPRVFYPTIRGPVRLELGKDFNVSFADNVEVGNAMLVVYGKGRYRGKKEVTFIIRKL
jgi:hypothetical protein